MSKVLIQKGTGMLYMATPELEARKDMSEYKPEVKPEAKADAVKEDKPEAKAEEK